MTFEEWWNNKINLSNTMLDANLAREAWRVSQQSAEEEIKTLKAKFVPQEERLQLIKSLQEQLKEEKQKTKELTKILNEMPTVNQ